MVSYAPLHLRVTTPQIELVGATDHLLEKLEPIVRTGKASAEPAPYDDPMSLYEEDPEIRVVKWLQSVWRGRGIVTADFWRLNLIVMLNNKPVGMQDVIGDHFNTYGTVGTFSWLSSDVRQRGIGSEIRQAALHLAFDGLEAREATSEAFIDNLGSNGVSRRLGYKENGVTWASRHGEPALMQRWRLTREDWLPHRRSDIEMYGVASTRKVLRK